MGLRESWPTLLNMCEHNGPYQQQQSGCVPGGFYVQMPGTEEAGI